MRTLLQKCCDLVGGLTILEAKERVETEQKYERVMGYDLLAVRFSAK